MGAHRAMKRNGASTFNRCWKRSVPLRPALPSAMIPTVARYRATLELAVPVPYSTGSAMVPPMAGFAYHAA